MEKKKGFSLLKFIIVLICLVLIAFSVAVNVLFAGGKTPKILDNYIYIVKESDNVSTWLDTGAAVIASDAKNSSIAKGDIVLCHPADAPDALLPRSIYNIDIDENGLSTFTTADAAQIPSEQTITKESIVAICTGHTTSAELGQAIKIAQTIQGMVAMLIIPCIILLILLIAKIVSSKDNSDIVEEENYDFYEYDGDDKKKKNGPKNPASHEKSPSAPLFEPSQEIQPSDDLERKKMSIAENFSQKKVNPNSPYQKEKERTMQFKAQMAAKQDSASANTASTSPAPTADTLRDEILKKNEKPANTGSFGAIKPLDRPVQQPVEAKPAEAHVQPKKSSSPDISDILQKSENSARKKKPEDISVDDLVKLIEEEKKKLS